MSSLWSELEQVLDEVQKPARYIGGEDGMIVPAHHPDKAAWLLIYPDTYEVGLPNQGLQILYEILNERPDAVAERSYAPWTDMGTAAVLGRHSPAGRRVRRAGFQPRGRTPLHEPARVH